MLAKEYISRLKAWRARLSLVAGDVDMAWLYVFPAAMVAALCLTVLLHPEARRMTV
jgi:hypothetical protein